MENGGAINGNFPNDSRCGYSIIFACFGGAIEGWAGHMITAPRILCIEEPALAGAVDSLSLAMRQSLRNRMSPLTLRVATSFCLRQLNGLSGLCVAWVFS